MKKDFLPIILGSDENAYGTARLFREAYDVRPLLVCAHPLIATSYSRLFDLSVVENFDDEAVFPDALDAILRRCGEEYVHLLVVPCSDYYTSLLVRHYDRFGERIANRFISPELLASLDTKDKFYALCEKHGLDFPKTVVCAPEERERVIDELPFPFPIVVKPENSNAHEYLHCKFDGKQKVYFFADREAYLAMVRAMNTSDYQGKLIIQEFVEGGDDAMRVMNVYCDAASRARMLCLGQPVLEYYDPATAGNYAAILTRGDDELYARVKGFLQEIGYVGFANFDMKFDRRTGRYVMFEINPRLGRSSFFVRAAGHNMMRFLVDDVVYDRAPEYVCNKTVALWSNVPLGILRRYVKNEALVREITSLPVTRTLFYRGDLSLRRLLRVGKQFFAQYGGFKKYYFDKEREFSKM